MLRASFATLCVVVLLSSISFLTIQSQQPDEDSSSTGSAIDDAFDTVNSQAFSSQAEKAQQLAAWMAANQWQDLTLDRRTRLMRGLADRSPLSEVLSVRWTGSISAPASGNYKFTAYNNQHFPGKCRLWVNDQLVINASDTAKVANGEAKRVSDPVTLTQGEPASLRLEFEHLPFARRESPADDISAETVVSLLWESDNLSRQLVPANSFSPPDGFSDGSSNGLRGEYFADGGFATPRFDQLDESVDLKSQVVTNTAQCERSGNCILNLVCLLGRASLL